MQEQISYRAKVQQICETIKPIGRFTLYSNDGLSARLAFVPRGKENATEEKTDFVVNSLREIGFTNVHNNKEKNNFFHSVYATITCEYNLQRTKIQSANIHDIQALYNLIEFATVWCVVFFPCETENKEDRIQLPYYKYKAHLNNFLAQHVNEMQK